MATKETKAEEREVNETIESKDLTGQRFGRLSVVERVPLDHPLSAGQRPAWLCKCDCGREIIVLQKSLLSCASASCGCAAMRMI